MLPTIKKTVHKTIVYGLAWCFGISLIVASLITYFDSTRTVMDFVMSFAISVGYSFSYWGSTVYLVYYLGKKYDWLKESKKRIISGVVGTLLVSFGVTFLMHFVLLVLPGKLEFIRLFSWQAFESYLLPATVNLILSLWFHLQSFFFNWKKSALNEERLKSENALAKLEALQQQVDPHFLFNTFNVLTGLIEEDGKLAQKFVTQLAKVYRYIIEMRSKTLVDLEDELGFAKSYLFLLKIRFDEGFSYSIEVEDAFFKKKLIPASIQLLVENAIKHNVVNQQKPMHLSLYIEDNYFCVSNNLNPKERIQNSSTGIGLTNISSRYALIDEEREPIISKSNTDFTVKLPLY